MRLAQVAFLYNKCSGCKCRVRFCFLLNHRWCDRLIKITISMDTLPSCQWQACRVYPVSFCWVIRAISYTDAEDFAVYIHIGSFLYAALLTRADASTRAKNPTQYKCHKRLYKWLPRHTKVTTDISLAALVDLIPVSCRRSTWRRHNGLCTSITSYVPSDLDITREEGKVFSKSPRDLPPIYGGISESPLTIRQNTYGSISVFSHVFSHQYRSV
jgi:hypothetical protein